jgi:hypothetical protein
MLMYKMTHLPTGCCIKWLYYFSGPVIIPVLIVVSQSSPTNYMRHAPHKPLHYFGYHGHYNSPYWRKSKYGHDYKKYPHDKMFIYGNRRSPQGGISIYLQG